MDPYVIKKHAWEAWVGNGSTGMRIKGTEKPDRVTLEAFKGKSYGMDVRNARKVGEAILAICDAIESEV